MYVHFIFRLRKKKNSESQECRRPLCQQCKKSHLGLLLPDFSGDFARFDLLETNLVAEGLDVGLFENYISHTAC